MLGITRRGFIKTSAAIAGAAAVGIGAERTFREHGPVDLKLLFLSDDPLVIKTRIYADERLKRFGIWALDSDTQGAWFRLGAVALALETPGYRFSCDGHALEKDGPTKIFPMTVHREYEMGKRDDLVIQVGTEKMPYWISVKDVQRVVKVDAGEWRSA